jgi:hypothetical protein
MSKSRTSSEIGAINVAKAIGSIAHSSQDHSSVTEDR